MTASPDSPRPVERPVTLNYAGSMTSEQPATRFTAAVTRDGDLHVARCLEVEVTSQGTTFDEALANLREALELYFEDEPVTEHTAPIIALVDVCISA